MDIEALKKVLPVFDFSLLLIILVFSTKVLQPQQSSVDVDPLKIESKLSVLTAEQNGLRKDLDAMSQEIGRLTQNLADMMHNLTKANPIEAEAGAPTELKTIHGSSARMGMVNAQPPASDVGQITHREA
jgi:hypothetical protein